MGKPRLIILIRHAQSEGNRNKAIHQVVPDHRVKLTDEGRLQAEDAGRRLRHLLKPDDTLQIFTSPYRRTRETTEGILKTLTSASEDDGPSPFSRSKIKLYEEPRLREQDFGNFQPCSAEMERMWRERADYGHFFYRIPNGESAADAYDRVSGFNESLWRQFGDKEFPSVLVLVTHGLMTRVFLMKWYHWSVEYFEDLRNINHCEFVLMKMNQESGKYILESELRTWSEYKRQRAEEASKKNPSRRNTLSAFLRQPPVVEKYHENTMRKEAGSLAPQVVAEVEQPRANANDDHPAPETLVDGTTESNNTSLRPPSAKPIPSHLLKSHHSTSGSATPHEMPSDEENEAFPFPEDQVSHGNTRSIATAMRKAPERKPTQEDVERWMKDSGMGQGKQADALGDEAELELEVEVEEAYVRKDVY